MDVNNYFLLTSNRYAVHIGLQFFYQYNLCFFYNYLLWKWCILFFKGTSKNSHIWAEVISLTHFAKPTPQQKEVITLESVRLSAHNWRIDWLWYGFCTQISRQDIVIPCKWYIEGSICWFEHIETCYKSDTLTPQMPLPVSVRWSLHTTRA